MRKVIHFAFARWLWAGTPTTAAEVIVLSQGDDYRSEDQADAWTRAENRTIVTTAIIYTFKKLAQNLD
jgi:hypothetical protein